MAWGSMVVGSVLAGGTDRTLSGIDDLEWASGPGGLILYATTGAGGGISAWTAGAGGRLAAYDHIGLPPSAATGIDGELVLIDGAVPLVASTGIKGTGLWAAGLDGTGRIVAKATLAPAAGALPADLHDATCVGSGGSTYLYGLRLGSTSVSAWKVGAGGALTLVRDPAPKGPASDGASIAALGSTMRGGATFLLGASGEDDALVSWRLNGSGIPAEAGRISAAQGVGIDAPSGIASAVVGGRAFAIMTASGSGTITVAEVRSDGTLVLTDHVVDDRGTRFAGAAQVSAVEWGGRAFVAVAGSDLGVTLFELLPGGRLLALSTVADTTTATLSAIGALDVAVSGGDLLVAVTSGREAGITTLRAPLPAGGVVRAGGTGADTFVGTSGADLLDGGAGDDSLIGDIGDDVLMDGAGSDRLAGRAGADIFVLAADGVVDTISDFDPSRDLLDLSGWSGLRQTGQLVIAPTGNGAQITFGTEVLRLVSIDGHPLSVAEVRALPVLGATRILPPPFVPPVTLVGTAGDDTLRGTDGADKLKGDGGQDSLHGLDGADLLYGGDGFDSVEGWTGDDAIWGGMGSDGLRGGGGLDRIYAEGGDDEAWGGADADSFWGDLGRDTLWGESGDDRLQGDEDDDTLHGNGENDSLRGDDGDDSLWGDPGDDSLAGGAGDDLVAGGAGINRLSGGAGADEFLFEGGQDRVTDFEDNLDLIRIDDAVWGGGSRTPSQMLAWATVQGSEVIFAFPDGSTLRVAGLTDPSRLLDDLAVG